MFGRRKDGRKIKTIDPIMRMTAHIMPTRNDAMVNSLVSIDCKPLDDFINKRLDEGQKYSYMDIVVCALVRMYAERPAMNRFAMDGLIYARNKIQICFVVKKSLKDGADETTVKLTFTGKESLLDVHNMIQEIVLANKGDEASNDTDGLAKALNKMPNWLLKYVVKFVKHLDRRGLLPNSLLELSPFHCSCFLTNNKSISCNYVYHHIYNFGTCSLFAGMGKEEIEPVVGEDGVSIRQGKNLKIGVTIDERICDGLYNSKSIKLVKKYCKNPELLETPLTEVVKDID